MVTGLILSFFGASSLASIVVFAACVASSRADRIQQGAFGPAPEELEHITAKPQLTLASSSV